MRALLLGSMLLCLPAIGQPQHGTWHFGYGAGLSFSGGAPAALPSGPVHSTEGCASINDASGQLLFSTDGRTVYDRNGNVLPYGTGLGGDESSAQSAVIVPFVGDPDRYYIFTTPAAVAHWTGAYSGLSYSVVNMALANGSGAMEEVNVPLVEHVTEHLTAVRHANGRDVWVLVHDWGSTVYHAFLVTCTGVEGPVDSAIGMTIGPDAAGSYISAGCIDVAPQGDRLALTWSDLSVAPDASMARLDVLRFNNATGVITAGSSVQHGGTAGANMRGYGVAFSPDGTRLYWSVNGGTMADNRLLQFDLTAADIAASEQTIMSGDDALGTLQLGPDGRLYAAVTGGATALAVVAEPNTLGPACGFQMHGVSIAPAQSAWGLPNQWDTYPLPIPLPPMTLNDTLICNGAAFIADATYEHPFETPTYRWSTGATTPTITITAADTYTVQVALRCDTLTDVFTVAFGDLQVDLGADRALCIGDSLDLEVPSAEANSIFWSTGDTTRTTTIHAEGEVWVTLSDAIGCVVSDTLQVRMTDCTCTVFLPNAFTPNMDQLNDAFGVQSWCAFLHFRLTVFDRWGHALFTSTDPTATWNGTEVSDGSYPWTLEYAWNDGQRVRHASRKGHIAVLR